MLRATGLKKIKASSMLCLIVMLSGLFFLPDNVNGLEQVGDCIYLWYFYYYSDSKYLLHIIIKSSEIG